MINNEDFSSYNELSWYTETDNLMNHLVNIEYNLASALPSLNNYLYKFIFQDYPVLTNTVADAFSLFKQDSPLYFYNAEQFDNSDGSHNYYAYLTNFYVQVSTKESDSELTNWFARVETLIAALVFANDDSSTNTVDSSYGRVQRQQLIDSLNGLSSSPSLVLNQVDDVGHGIVQSLTTIKSSFSRFASGPSQVKLVDLGNDESIGFNSSEITYLVNACRCVTTLIWTFGGLWLLFVFVYWAFKQSYNLLVFCWSVCSSIFGGGAK